MRSFLRLSLLAFAALLPACAADDSDIDPGGLDPIPGTAVGVCDDDTLEAPEFEHVMLPAGFSVADDDHRAPPPIVNDASGGSAPVGSENDTIAVEAAGDVCECTSNACVTAWIEQRMGCGVCAHMVCDEGTVGGCVPCADADLDEPRAAKQPAKEACVLPGSLTADADPPADTIANNADF
jgi:hypothetical protein